MTFSNTEQTTISPHTQQPLPSSRRVYPTQQQLDDTIACSVSAQAQWSSVPLSERYKIGQAFVDNLKALIASPDEAREELTAQMGRPIAQTLGELKGCLGRAEHLLAIAQSSLADVPLTETDAPGFRRYIRRTPLGVVLVMTPWNFPYLVTINSVLPALLAGNTVLLKPSPQTPLTAERFLSLFSSAGLPERCLQILHLPPLLINYTISHPAIAFVSFTGSVQAGRDVQLAVAEAPGFKGCALELGGKDPAYVREDADLEYTVAELVDGAFFNSGQSCCAIERIYVHTSLYDKFVSRFVDLVKQYKLGDPTDPKTTLGPVISIPAAERIRKQISDAIAAGAKPLVPSEPFSGIAKEGTAYVAPQVLVDVDHSMSIMHTETFGPVVGIMRVPSDSAAIQLMNDSPYGLTASIWTHDEKAFAELEGKVEAGTVFMNRCDFLDPALAWTGVKESGRGVSLSRFGYDQLTRAKSVHMKIKTS